MAYQSLLTARSDFSNFGGSLASIQENAVDVASSNQESNTFYQSLSNQIETAGLMEGIPSVPAIIGAGYGIYKSVKTLGSLKDTVAKGVSDAVDLAKSGASDLKGVAEKFVAQAQEGVSATTEAISSAANTVRSEATNLASTVQTEVGNVANTARDVAEGVVSTAQQGVESAVNSVRTGVENVSTSVAETVSQSVPAIETSIGGALPKVSASFQSASEAILPSGSTTAQLASGGAELGENVSDVLHTYSGFTSALKPQISFGQSVSNFFGFGSKAPITMTPLNAPVAQQASAVSENISSGIENVAGRATQGVETTLASTEKSVSNVASKLSSGVENVVGEGSKVLSTAGDVVGGLTSTVGEGVETATKLAVGLSDIALPVIGEIGLAGLGIFSAIKGFEDLFSHPKAPTVAPVPVVANISQSFQSGI